MLKRFACDKYVEKVSVAALNGECRPLDTTGKNIPQYSASEGDDAPKSGEGKWWVGIFYNVQC